MASFSGQVDGVGDLDLRFHYAQLAEDVLIGHILRIFLNIDRPGFYIDVGAFSPGEISNTRLMHLAGWRGINIDASREAIAAFREQRPDDVSIEHGIAREAGLRPYYVFQFTAASTFHERTRDQWLASGWKLTETRDLPVAPLRDVLAPHLPAGTVVDYLNIDIEGLDREALETYDFEAFPPKVVSIELHNLDLLRAGEHPAVSFLAERGYKFMAHALVTAIFMKAVSGSVSG